MKFNIEDYLHTIDKAFINKSQKDTYMTYIMVIAAIFAFSYLLFWDSSFDTFIKTRDNVVQLQKKLAADNLFLKNNPESRITQLDNEIKNIKNKIIATKDNNAYIKSKIETISSLIYGERTWGEYLDSISKNAQTHHIKIKEFTNNYADKHSSFGHILNIKIRSTGNYKNTLRFINSLEQSDLVVDIHDMKIEADEKLTSDFEISVWGITY